MIINLNEYNFFTFSWLNTSLDNIEKYEQNKKDCKSKIIRNNDVNIKINFEYNPEIIKTYFLQIKNGVIMLPNLQDGWSSYFYNLTEDLKLNGFHFSLSSEKEDEPYNCMTFIENGLRKRTCYTLKEGKTWTFFEDGKPLFFEEVNYYKNKLKKLKLNKEIILNYCNKLGITNGYKLEIITERNNLKMEYKNR